MSFVGEQIKKYRNIKGMTQQDIADALGESSGRVIYNWEKGIGRPDCDKLARLCDLLGVSADELIGCKSMAQRPTAKVLALRKKAGLSQEELAEKLEVSRQAISRWEMGVAMPDASNLLQLSKLFRVTVDFLINDEYASDEDIPIVKTKEASLNQEMKKVPAMIKSTLIGMAITLLLALLLFPFTAELPVLMIPIVALPFPTFYFSVFCKELKSLKLILSTSAVLLLAVNVITLAGFWISFHALHGQAYVHLILWDSIVCFMNAAALLSFGSFIAFAAQLGKWWVNLLIYIGEAVLWIAVVCILYGVTSDSSLSHIVTLLFGALLCVIGCVAYRLQAKKAGERHESE